MAKNYKKSDVSKAVAKSKGLVSAVANMLKCDWRTADRYIKKFGLQEELQNQTEIMLDFAESKLFQCIDEQEANMIKFYLESKGKSRGYGKETKVDMTTKGESINPVSIAFFNSDKQDNDDRD